jgi:hypothetical protein
MHTYPGVGARRYYSRLDPYLGWRRHHQGAIVQQQDSTGKITAADKVDNCEKAIAKNSADTLEELNQADLPRIR